MSKPVLFISDLHLAPSRPSINEVFIRFLRGPVREARSLYILGDLFDYWIGDDDRRDELNEVVIGTLGDTAAGGTQLFFLHGNRDFMLGEAAAERGGFKILNDPSEIDLFGQRTLLLHGDTLCTDDTAYQAYRARMRAPLNLRMTRAMPLAWRRVIARTLRARSEHSKRGKPAVIMDVNREAVDALFRAHHYPLMIHGHTHRPARHVHEVDGHRCERIVLADWYERGSYLRCTPSVFETVVTD